MIQFTRHLSLSIAASLLLATGAHAQVTKGRTEVLPVWNQHSGKVEAVLVLEPMSAKAWQFGNTRLDTALGVGSGQLGLICAPRAGLASAIGNLVDNCRLASFGGAGASIGRSGGRVGLGIANSRDTLPAWLVPGSRSAARIEANSLTLMGEKNLGREATVAIGGTIARAHLLSPAAVPTLADRWDIKTLTVGANVGQFGANIIGRVVDSPASADRWQGLSLGLTWRTPWSGQLSVGADNVVTHGRNPFAPSVDGRDEEGAIPYVRYQQDL